MGVDTHAKKRLPRKSRILRHPRPSSSPTIPPQQPSQPNAAVTDSNDDVSIIKKPVGESLGKEETQESSPPPKTRRLQQRSLPTCTKTKDSSESGDDPSLVCLVPTKHDVVFGAGGMANQKRMGSLYTSLLNSHFAEYSTLRLSKKDEFVRIHIIEPIRQKGGRFLEIANSKTAPDDSSRYYLYDPTKHRVVIARKVKQALRDKTRKPRILKPPRLSPSTILRKKPSRPRPPRPPPPRPSRPPPAAASAAAAAASAAASAAAAATTSMDDYGDNIDDDTVMKKPGKEENQDISSTPKTRRLQQRSLPTSTKTLDSSDSSDAPTLITLVPTKNDAVFGVGGTANQKRIGSLYTSLLNAHFAEYITLRQPEKEEFVRIHIIEPICQEGGRFLEIVKSDVAAKKSSKTTKGQHSYFCYMYDPAEHWSVITRKVKQALRDRAKAAGKTRRQSTSTELPALSSFRNPARTKDRFDSNMAETRGQPRRSSRRTKATQFSNNSSHVTRTDPENAGLRRDRQQSMFDFYGMDDGDDANDNNSAEAEQNVANEPAVSGQTILF